MEINGNALRGRRVAVVGAGVVGLASAWCAQRAGAEVTVLERGRVGAGSSFGNAGLVVPSFYHPLCAPGVVAEGLGQLGDPEGFFAIKARLEPALLAWLVRFAVNCSRKRYGPKAAILARLNWESLKLHLAWALEWGRDYDFAQEGLLYVYRDGAELTKGIRTLEEAKLHGFTGRVLDVSELERFQPGLSGELLGGVYYDFDARLRPESFLQTLAREVRNLGGAILEDAEVYGFDLKADRVMAVRTTAGEIAADEFVLAGGAWLGELAAMLGKKIPLEGGKGVSLTFSPAPGKLNQPLLMDCHCAATSFADAMRVTGVMEICGTDLNLAPRRVEGLKRAASRYMPWLENARPGLVWRGLRPCVCDGLPIMGRLKKYPNVTLAGGHDQKGISLAPVSGSLVAMILAGRELPHGFGPAFSPERF